MKTVKRFAIPALMAVLGFGLGWIMQPPPPDPVVQIKNVRVEPVTVEGATHLRITTAYSNTGCTQVLLTRFLLNTRPAPSIALPQQQGPSILPIDKNEFIEDVTISFTLTEGQWHLFSVASCYLNGDPVPAATVAPTALFDIEAVTG